jgi:integrase
MFRTLSSLRGSDFAKYRDARLLEGKAPNTVRLELALVGHLFETARKEWGMESLLNPIRNIRKPSVPSGRERRLEDDEYEKVVATIKAHCEGHWMLAAFELALSTALRLSMLLKLR